MRPWRSRPHQHAKTGATKRITKNKGRKTNNNKTKTNTSKTKAKGSTPRPSCFVMFLFLLSFHFDLCSPGCRARRSSCSSRGATRVRPWRSRPHQHVKACATKRTTKKGRTTSNNKTKTNKSKAKTKGSSPRPGCFVYVPFPFLCMFTFVRPVAAHDGVLIVAREHVRCAPACALRPCAPALRPGPGPAPMRPMRPCALALRPGPGPAPMRPMRPVCPCTHAHMRPCALALRPGLAPRPCPMRPCAHGA